MEEQGKGRWGGRKEGHGEVGESEGSRGGKGGMGVDQTNFGSKSTLLVQCISVCWLFSI